MKETVSGFCPFRDLPDGARQKEFPPKLHSGAAFLKSAVGKDGNARYSVGVI